MKPVCRRIVDCRAQLRNFKAPLFAKVTVRIEILEADDPRDHMIQSQNNSFYERVSSVNASTWG